MGNMVDRLARASSALAFKAPCRVATTANITLSRFQMIDGILPTSGQHESFRRILVRRQNLAAENGIWVMTSSAWSRAKDFDSVNDFREGTRVYVYEGSTQSGGYVVSSDMDPDTFEMDVDDITFASASAGDLASFLTTRGDIAVRGASAVQRLPLGTSGQFLRSNGTDLAWASPGSSALTFDGVLSSATSTPIDTDALLTASSTTGGFFSDYECKGANKIVLVQDEDQTGIDSGGFRDALVIQHVDRDLEDYEPSGNQKVSWGIRSLVTGYNDGSGYQAQTKDFVGGDFAAIANCSWDPRGVSARHAWPS